MNSKRDDQSVMNLGPKPHKWELAAEYLVSRLEVPLRDWLRESGLPGTVNVAADGSWPVGDRIQFLKLLCGGIQ